MRSFDHGSYWDSSKDRLRARQGLWPNGWVRGNADGSPSPQSGRFLEPMSKGRGLSQEILVGA